MTKQTILPGSYKVDGKTRINARAEQSVYELKLHDRLFGESVSLDMIDPIAAQADQDLAADIFHSLYKTAPTFRAEVSDKRQINKRIMEWTEDAMKTAAESTAGSVAGARAATPGLFKHLTNDETLKDILEAQREIEEKQDQKKQCEAGAAGLDMAAATEPDKAQAQALKAQAQAERGKADQLGAEIEAKLSMALDKMGQVEQSPLHRHSLQAAAKQAREKSEQMKNAMKGWGIEEGSAETHDPQTALEFAEAITDRLLKMAELAGRMREVARKESRKAKQTVGMIPTDITHTRKIELLLPQEAAKIVNNPLRPEALTKLNQIAFLNHGLLGLELTGQAQKSGPFVLMLDGSGSMASGAGYEGLSPFDSGLAIALGMAFHAKDQNRAFVLGTFGGPNDAIKFVTSNDDWRALIAWASQRPNGGTDFDKALNFAYEQLTGDFNSDYAADCVFVTDGVCSTSPAVIAKWEGLKEANGTRLFYVPVDGTGSNEAMENLAERVLYLSDFGPDFAKSVGGWLKR